MKPAIIAVCLLSACAFADEDQDAYCKYVTEQAAAERDRLRTPNVVAGLTQPNSGLPMQVVWGVSSSVANNRKAVLTMQVSRKNCQLYKAAVEAQMHVQYALPEIERDVLQHRLELIEQATAQLEILLAANMKLVEAQNMTRPALYPLKAAKVRLNSSRVTTSIEITSRYVPQLSSTPLRDLIASKLDSDREAQKAMAKLERQNNWDLALSVGAHHQVRPLSQEKVAAYGEISFSYNLADWAIGRHLREATESYGRWKAVQAGDVAYAAEILRSQIAQTIAIQEGQLALLRDQDKEIDRDLEHLDGINTNAAVGFRNQLIADQLVLRVDLGDMVFRLDKLHAFLRDNF